MHNNTDNLRSVSSLNNLNKLHLKDLSLIMISACLKITNSVRILSIPAFFYSIHSFPFIFTVLHFNTSLYTAPHISSKALYIFLSIRLNYKWLLKTCLTIVLGRRFIKKITITGITSKDYSHTQLKNHLTLFSLEEDTLKSTNFDYYKKNSILICNI